MQISTDPTDVTRVTCAGLQPRADRGAQHVKPLGVHASAGLEQRHGTQLLGNRILQGGHALALHAARVVPPPLWPHLYQRAGSRRQDGQHAGALLPVACTYQYPGYGYSNVQECAYSYINVQGVLAVLAKTTNMQVRCCQLLALTSMGYATFMTESAYS